jgi:hypothetical protein
MFKLPLFALCFAALSVILFAQQQVTSTTTGSVKILKVPEAHACTPEENFQRLNKMQPNSLVSFDMNGCTTEVKQAPFDVPPVETHGPDTTTDYDCRKWAESGCTELPTRLTLHRTCADKTRFLMFSEDGKWHCLALSQRP